MKDDKTILITDVFINKKRIRHNKRIKTSELNTFKISLKDKHKADFVLCNYVEVG